MAASLGVEFCYNTDLEKYFFKLTTPQSNKIIPQKPWGNYWQQISAGDLWGGLVGMLVALPAAIAFGVTVYAPLGAEHSAAGALAGVLGTIILAMVCAILGSSRGLVTVPSAPVVALLSAFSLAFIQSGGDGYSALPMLLILGFVTGWLQIILGLFKVGKLIQYVPYPVISGYLSGVGIYIILGQIQKLLGADKSLSLFTALTTPSSWQLQGLLIGIVTMVCMVAWINIEKVLMFSGSLTIPATIRKIPAPIIGLIAGGLVYVILGINDVNLRTNINNSLVIGPLIKGDASLWATLTQHWREIKNIKWAMVEYVIGTAITLAVLLSIDTLKTCIVLDVLTNQRHDSNRELISQGIGNMLCALVGGLPGSGAMGATLVNVSAGAQSRFSGFFVGLFALITLIAFGGIIGWVPVAALASILIVVGFRMIDIKSIKLAQRKATRLEFVVTLVVIITANTYGLLTASLMGVALAVFLFLRENIRISIIRRINFGNNQFSKRMRTGEEMAILETLGEKTCIVELQGSLFFGTAYQIQTKLEEAINSCNYIILDFRRVQSLDITAVNVLQKLSQQMEQKKGFLIFSRFPYHLPSGTDVEAYIEQLGVNKDSPDISSNTSSPKLFPEFDLALEWVENQLLQTHFQNAAPENLLELRDMEIFKSRKQTTLAALEEVMEKKSYAPGAYIFKAGDKNNQLFLIRRGMVRIILPIKKYKNHNLGTISKGTFFGEMAFLDAESRRSADAVADTEVELFVLEREVFLQLMEKHKKLAFDLIESLALILAKRLRFTNREIQRLES